MGKIPMAFRRLASDSMAASLVKASTSASVQERTKPQIPQLKTRKRSPIGSYRYKNNGGESSKTNPPSITFDSPNLAEAKAIFNSIVSSPKNAPSDADFYNKILLSYSSVSSLQDSIFFLNHMLKTHPPFVPNRYTYHLLLAQACSSPSLSGLERVFNLMESNGFPLNQVSADVAVRALCGSSREFDAIELVKKLCAKNLLPDEYTYNFMVKHSVKNMSLSTVNSFVEDMKEFGIKPNLVTYTIMIDNVCNSKNLREATRLLEILSKEGYKPDCYVYNTIMKGYCNLGSGNDVLGVYKKMLDEGIEPDKYTYNTLIFGLSKSGRVKDARKFLGVMSEKGHIPDAVTYTSLMNGMCREGDALGALNLLQEMEDKGCVPNSCTYNTLLHGLCKGRLLDKGVELYEMMKKSDVKLETGSYGTFLRALCKKGRVSEAYGVFDYAIESKSFAEVAAYSTLEGTLKWLRKAKEQGLVFS